jgi:hypothetical protein
MHDLQKKVAEDVANAILRVTQFAVDSEMKVALTLQASSTAVGALAFLIEREGGKRDHTPTHLSTILIASLMCAHSLTEPDGIDLIELMTKAKQEVIDMVKAGIHVNVELAS